MANYTPSNKAKAQAMLFDRFKTEALKFRFPATYLKYLEMTEIMIPSHKVLRSREDRTVEAYTNARTARALNGARSHNHTGDKGDSLVLTPSWAIGQDPFSISLKQGDNNVFTYPEMLLNEFENSFRNHMEGREQEAIDFSFNNRTQVDNTSTTQATWDGTDFVVTIDEATNGNRAPQIAKTVMEENNLHGSYTFFCDSQAYDKFAFDSAQGSGNSTNLSFQYDNITFVRSIGLDTNYGGLAGTYTKGNFIAVPDGTIGYLDWIPKQNREGKVTTEQTYSNIINPIDNLTYALHKYSERSDESASNGETQDELEQFEISNDGAFVSAILTAASETVLKAFALV